MEQFLTGDIWKEVNKLFNMREKKIACIAYVTSENLQLKKGDTLICDASDEEIKFGATSAKVLNTYFKKGVKLFSHQNLHSKFLLTKSFLVIGSANLSNRSAGTLVESVVITDNEILLNQTSAFCHNILADTKTIALTKQHLERLLKLPVVRRKYKAATKSKIREKKFGNRFWYIPLGDLSDRTLNKVKDKLSRSKKKVIDKTEFAEEDLNSIYLRSNTKFTSKVIEGDQLMKVWYNENKTRRYVFPFATVLAVDREKEETIIIYDDTNNGENISLTKFLSLTKDLKLEKAVEKLREKELSIKDAMKLKAIWK